MTRQLLVKMLAGLTPAEQTATLEDLQVAAGDRAALMTEAAALSGNVGVSAPATIVGNAAPVFVPSVAAAVPALPAGQPDISQLMQQLANEKAARITGECQAFMLANASKISPTENVHVQATYAALAGSADPQLLATYKAGIEARPVNAMFGERVASTSTVLGNGGGTDTRTEAQKESDLVNSMLGMTAKGQEARTTLTTGVAVVETEDAKYKRVPDFEGAMIQFGLMPPRER